MIENIYAGNSGLKRGQGFHCADGVALCGFVQNQYDMSASTLQAKINDLDIYKLLPCKAVSIKNDNDETEGQGLMTGLNPKTFIIEKVAESTSDIVDGFILESPTNLIDISGNAGIPLPHGMLNIGKIGSAIKVFLPANENLINVNLSAALYWAPAKNELNKASGIELKGVQLLSSVIKGFKREYNEKDKTIEWTDVSCVLVKL